MRIMITMKELIRDHLKYIESKHGFKLDTNTSKLMGSYNAEYPIEEFSIEVETERETNESNDN